MTPDLFKSWRKSLKLTQRDAAKALGLSLATIQLYEAGQRFDTGATVVIPTTVGLACAAVNAGLVPIPWRVERSEDRWIICDAVGPLMEARRLPSGGWGAFDDLGERDDEEGAKGYPSPERVVLFTRIKFSLQRKPGEDDGA
ncbi:helix-turn-helix domain-containing protein [Novispirillum itersonii]|uniref:helix-turn-helix domain-containing protein n=1 Tax=Novispirillum itersonii TaxID=189 RepID=UPI0003807E27|nr:helix-turn-helix transcriptional regulator [Novispirillum itersonii]